MNKPYVLLVCYVSAEIGIGHLSRLLALAETLSKDNKVIPEFLIFGDLFKKNDLANFKVHSFSIKDDFVSTIENITKKNKFDALILDFYSKLNIYNLRELFMSFKKRNFYLISIDSLINYRDILDIVWIPSFNYDFSKYSDHVGLLKSGWDSFLIRKRLHQKNWNPGSKVLVLTGGSDVANLGETLPTQLDKTLDKNLEIHWVKGPFSCAPNLPRKCRLNWVVHNAPENLDELIVQSNYVMSVFGVSFFEVLQYGIPTVVFSPYGDKDNDDLNELSKENVAMVFNNSELAIKGLVELTRNDELAKKYSTNALTKMSVNGVQNLCNEIYSLIGSK